MSVMPRVLGENAENGDDVTLASLNRIENIPHEEKARVIQAIEEAKQQKDEVRLATFRNLLDHGMEGFRVIIQKLLKTA